MLAEPIYTRALEQWLRRAPVEARRGNIYDRNGSLIVGSALAPSLVAIPKQVKDVEKTAKVLVSILKVKPEKIKAHFKNVSVEILKPEGKKISEQAQSSTSQTGRDLFGGRYGAKLSLLTLSAQVIGITGIDNQEYRA